MADVSSLVAICKAFIGDLRCLGFTDEFIGDLRHPAGVEEVEEF